MARGKYEELFSTTGRFSPSTRKCLERAVGQALFGRKGARVTLSSAVGNATRELRAQGLDPVATVAFLSAMVENAGRACRADRASLLSGEPLWMAVHARVLDAAHFELAEAVA